MWKLAAHICPFTLLSRTTSTYFIISRFYSSLLLLSFSALRNLELLLAHDKYKAAFRTLFINTREKSGQRYVAKVVNNALINPTCATEYSNDAYEAQHVARNWN
jgi:hypothetical protein